MNGLRVLLSVLLAVQQVIFGVLPACARDSRGAEAGFQDEVQGSTEGGPIFDGPDRRQSMPKAGPPGTPIQSTQIGTSRSTPLYEDKKTGEPLDSKVTVRLKDAPLSTFLEIISAQSKINFILGTGVDRQRATAFLNKVKVRGALEILLQIRGFTYRRIGKSNTYVVTKRSAQAPNVVTKIYT
ncbi:MAG: STN domain-containing protein, partial [bacterium]